MLPAQWAASSICKICSAPCSTWSWESSSTWKPSRHHRVASTADSQRAKLGLWRWVFIIAGVAASRVQHCWPQPCSRQDHLLLGCSEAEARAGNQSWEREEETASNGCWPRVARQQQFEDLLNSSVCWWLKLIGFKIYSTHWSCEGSRNTCSLSVQLKSWLNYKAYIASQVFRLIVLSCCWVLFIRNHKISHEIRFVNSQIFISCMNS